MTSTITNVSRWDHSHSCIVMWWSALVSNSSWWNVLAIELLNAAARSPANCSRRLCSRLKDRPELFSSILTRTVTERRHSKSYIKALYVSWSSHIKQKHGSVVYKSCTSRANVSLSTLRTWDWISRRLHFYGMKQNRCRPDGERPWRGPLRLHYCNRKRTEARGQTHTTHYPQAIVYLSHHNSKCVPVSAYVHVVHLLHLYEFRV